VEALPAVIVPFSFCSAHKTDCLVYSAAGTHFGADCNTPLILHSTNIPDKSIVQLLLGNILFPADTNSIGILYNHTECACLNGRLMQAISSFPKSFEQTTA
jgi:hypothetical protein